MARSELEQKVWDLFEQGLSDNEILNQLVSEEDEELTFMELRILRAEYEEEHPESLPDEEVPEPEEEEEDQAGEDVDIIEFDAIKKPGTLMSGTANLPSGMRIGWALDQMGRVNVFPLQEGDQPTQGDLQIFQEELQKEIMKRGGMV